MTLDDLTRRHALMAWRDTCTQGIWVVFHLAAQAALEQVAADLGDAGMRDTYWDPASFVRPRIDAAMRKALAGPLAGLMHQAGQELCVIDPALRGLSTHLALAAANAIGVEPLALPSADATAGPQSHWIFEKNRPWHEQAFHTGIAGLTAAIFAPEMLTGVVGYGVATLAKPLFSFRLKAAAEARLIEVWTGSAGEPPPSMARSLSTIDRVLSQAQGMN